MLKNWQLKKHSPAPTHHNSIWISLPHWYDSVSFFASLFIIYFRFLLSLHLLYKVVHSESLLSLTIREIILSKFCKASIVKMVYFIQIILGLFFKVLNSLCTTKCLMPLLKMKLPQVAWIIYHLKLILGFTLNSYFLMKNILNN